MTAHVCSAYYVAEALMIKDGKKQIDKWYQMIYMIDIMIFRILA